MPVKTAVRYRNIHGVLLLDKPIGLTSNGALQIARRLFLAKKAGHTGSLDPLANGLLPICFGEATKFSSYLLDSDKAYQATLHFGITTTTGDSEGDIIAQKKVSFSKEALCKVLNSYCGPIQQMPPMYSALKHQGQPLYRYARSGITIERSPRDIMVHRIDLIDYQRDKAILAIVCSKGTYIRTLAEDIGTSLHCGAHLSALKRHAVGDFNLNDAISLEKLEALTEKERLTRLLSIELLVENLPAIILDEKIALRFKQGQSVPLFYQNSAILQRYRIYSQHTSHNKFMGVGEVCTPGFIAPIRLLSDNPLLEGQ